MDWFKKLLATALGLFFIHTSTAQQHYNLWLRGTLTFPLNRQINMDTELQHRRQNSLTNRDLFDRTLMYSFRTWLHYQYNKEVRFSISPFAYFSNYKIIQTQQDQTANPGHEFRISGAIETRNTILPELSLISRAALEYRILENRSDITRLRNKSGLQFTLNPCMKLTASDELLLNIAGAGGGHFYDHNRVGIDLEYTITRGLKTNLGYLYISRLPMTGNGNLHEHNFFANLVCTLHK